jgi:autophagy-related protein 33
MKKAAAARARMEASYEVLGSGGSEASHGEVEVEDLNGEEIRSKVQVFLKKQIMQMGLTTVGFVIAVVGIWGDAVSPSPVYVRGFR